jgi:hypothetical protein
VLNCAADLWWPEEAAPSQSPTGVSGPRCEVEPAESCSLHSAARVLLAGPVHNTSQAEAHVLSVTVPTLHKTLATELDFSLKLLHIKHSKHVTKRLSLWSRVFLYKLTCAQLLVLILCQMNPVYTLPSSSFKIHFNIILSLMPRSYTWTSSLKFMYPNSACISFQTFVLHAPPITSSLM